LRLFARQRALCRQREELTPVRSDWISAVPLAVNGSIAAGFAEVGGQTSHAADLARICWI
jgi:hypothetical protein